MSTLNYSLSQLNDPKTCTHIQFPIKNDTGGKIGLIQDIDFGVMTGFGYDESPRIDDFKSFVSTLDSLFKNLNTRINDLKSTVDKLMSESLIASIEPKPTANSLTYNGNSQDLITPGMANNGVMYYSSTYDGSYSTSLPQGTNAGAYTVFYYAKGNTGYKDSPKRQLDVTIAKASSLKTAPTVTSQVIIHNNSSHDLINAGTTNSGTMEYGVKFNNSSINNPPSLWTSDIPQGKDSGTYYIWYRIQNGVNSNYKEVNPTYLASVTITESTLPANNCYIGFGQNLTFTESDLNQYVATKPETIELPVGTSDDVSIWIYPKSWGKPIEANPIIDGSVDTSTNAINLFTYSNRFNLPEGYIGCYLALDSATTYKLTWQS